MQISDIFVGSSQERTMDRVSPEGDSIARGGGSTTPCSNSTSKERISSDGTSTERPGKKALSSTNTIAKQERPAVQRHTLLL